MYFDKLLTSKRGPPEPLEQYGQTMNEDIQRDNAEWRCKLKNDSEICAFWPRKIPLPIVFFQVNREKLRRSFVCLSFE